MSRDTDLDSVITILRQPTEWEELRRRSWREIYGEAGCTVGAALAAGLRPADLEYDVRQSHISADGPLSDPATRVSVLRRSKMNLGPTEERRHVRFAEIYRPGATVREVLAAGLCLRDVLYDVSHLYISLAPSVATMLDEATGMHYRPNTDHLAMITESRRLWASTAPDQEDIVLDIGAHVGGFSVWAARDRGVASVLAVEPAEDTFEILEQNTRGIPGLRTLRAAVTAEESGLVDLWLTSNHAGTGSCMASLTRRVGRRVVSVPSVSFARLMREERPTVLKIDAEEAEYTFPLGDEELMSSVRVLALEVHTKSGNAEAAARLVDTIERTFRLRSGDRALHERPMSLGTVWAVNGVWERRR